MTGVFDDHLGLDAIVAYVDGELGLTAFQRVSAHLIRCPQCASEVAEQEAVAACLRSAELPRMPGSLFDALTSIPLAVPNPAFNPDSAPPAGMPRDQRPGSGRRFRLGAGALVAGLAVGAVVTAAPTHPRMAVPRPRFEQTDTTPAPANVAEPVALRR